MSDLLTSKGYKPRTGKVKVCPTCLTEFYLKPSYGMRKFCSQKCASESFKKDKLSFNCIRCNRTILRPVKYVQLRGEPKYCSRTCMGKSKPKAVEVGKIVAKKKVTKTTVKRNLDKYFSMYIRLRDTTNGYGQCCSCGKTVPFSEGDAGHYISRRFLATRWREDNVFFQCRYCNRFLDGNGPGYARFMYRKFGVDHVDYLVGLSQAGGSYTITEMELLIKDYKQKVKLLKQSVIQ